MQLEIMAACMQAACPQLVPWLQASSLMHSKCRRLKSLQPVPHSQQPLSPAVSSLQLQLCMAGLPNALTAARHHPALCLHTPRLPSPRCCSSRRRSNGCLQMVQTKRSSRCRMMRAGRSFSRQQPQHQTCTTLNGL